MRSTSQAQVRLRDITTEQPFFTSVLSPPTCTTSFHSPDVQSFGEPAHTLHSTPCTSSEREAKLGGDQGCLLRETTQQLSQARALAWDSRSRVELLEGDLQQARRRADSLGSQLQSLSNSLQTVQALHEVQELGFQAERAELQDHLGQCQLSNQLLHEDKAQLVQECQEVQQLASSEAAKTAKAEACCHLLSQENQTVQQRADSLSSELESLSNSLQTVQALQEVQELGYQAQKAKLQDRLGECELDNKVLQEDKAHLAQLCQDIQQHASSDAAKAATAEACCHLLLQENQTLQQRADSLSSELESLSNSLQTIQALQEVQELGYQAQRAKLQDRLGECELDNKLLQQDKAHLTQLCQESEQHASSDAGKAATAEACCHLLLQENQTLHQGAQQHEAQLSSAETRAGQAEALCSFLSQQIQDLRQLAAMQQAQLSSAAEHSSENACLRISLDSAKTLLRSATDDYILVGTL